MSATVAEATYVFDARGIAKRFRHAAIFGALESLHDGETMRFINDHDPLPLINQITMRYGTQVAVEYVERGPEGVVIDFGVHPAGEAGANAGGNNAGGGCGGGGGCGCSGGL